MRERLVAVLVGVTVLVIVLLGVPRAYFLADLVESQEQASLQRVAELGSLALGHRLHTGEPVTSEVLSEIVSPVEGARYEGPGGPLTAGFDVARPDVLTARQPVAGGGTLTVARSRAWVDQQVSAAIVPLAVAAVLLTVFAILLAFWFARRLARPFQELAGAATSLGSGRFDEVTIDRYSIPEANNIGRALRTSADRLELLVRGEREFAANASHQLRTPITAMRLQLEDLVEWPETAPAVADELRVAIDELDRLTEAIKQFLLMSRGSRGLGGITDLTALAREARDRWRPSLQAQGRGIVTVAQGPLLAEVQPQSLGQILDVLVENSLTHGRGQVTLGVFADERHCLVRVDDEGPSPDDPRIFQRGHSTAGGTGVGLALARELAHGLGGRLELRRGATTSFELRLPRPSADR